MNKYKKVIGVVLILASIASMYTWERWGRDKYLYNEVLVYADDIDETEIITEGMLATKKVNYLPSSALTPKDINKIIGQAARSFLNKGSYVFTNQVEVAELSVDVNKDSYIMSLPKEWLGNCPTSIERGDDVYFYSNGELITKAKVSHVKDSTNQEVKSLDPERLSLSANVGNVEVIVNASQIALLNNEEIKEEEVIVLYN